MVYFKALHVLCVVQSSRKVSPSRDLKRVLCKGEVGSSPMTSVSYPNIAFCYENKYLFFTSRLFCGETLTN